MRQPILLALIGTVLGAPVFVAAVDNQIDDAAIAQAIAVARRGETSTNTLHARYNVALGDPTYDRVEVITEYRRVIMTAEEHLKIGQLWDVSNAKAALAPYRGSVSFVVWIKFPPQNMLTQVPNYQMVIYPRGIPPPPSEPEILSPAAPELSILYPAGGGNVLVGPRGGGRRPPAVEPPADPLLRYGGGSAMSGVRIEGAVPSSSLDLTGRTIIGLLLDGTEQRQAVFNLGVLR